MAIMHAGRPLTGVATRRVASRRSCVSSRRRKTPAAGATGPTVAAEKREGDLLSFLYLARDAHFRRMTEESEINEYSGATKRS